MKKTIVSLLIMLYALMFSCQTEHTELKKNDEKVPDTIVTKLQKAGFDTTEGLFKYKNGYMVEYDILLTEDQIDELIRNKPNSKTPSEEHYRTNNLVAGSRVLGVFIDSGFDDYIQNAFNLALSRYNSLNLSIKFRRVTTSSTASISILSFYAENNILGFSAGFPSGGNPATPIRLNTFHYNSSQARADAASVIAHEIGHAIGFRHTDFMDRRFSCPTEVNDTNEGTGDEGAEHIPGTPTGPSSASWMLACSNNIDRPFTAEDVTALTTVYAPLGNILFPGDIMTQHQYIKSTDGRFLLSLQTDGNFVLYANGKAIWSSKTCCKSNITICTMQGDGNLVLYDNNYRPYWSSGTPSYPDSYLVLQNDGNAVIYQYGVARWATNTCCL